MAILDTHWRQAYSDAVTVLAGSHERSVLKELVRRDNQSGEVVYLDATGKKDKRTRTKMSDLDESRKDYEASAGKTWDDYKKGLTPHMDIDRQRTLCHPYRNIFGHGFRDIDEVADNANEHSDVLREGMSEMWEGCDWEIINALLAPSMLRGKTEAAPTTVAFPATQMITEAGGVLRQETFTQANRIFLDNRIRRDKKFMLISPTQQELLINASGDKLQNRDFVDGPSYLSSGTLPVIHGFHVIVDPLVDEFANDGTGTWDAGRAVAFTANAIVYNQFKELVTKLGEDPARQFEIYLMLREFIGAARVDDKQVVHINLGTRA